MDNGKEETEEAPIVQAARAVDAAQIRVNAAQLAFAKAEEELKAAGIDLAAARNDLATCLEPPKPAQAQKIDGINPASDLFKVLTAIRDRADRKGHGRQRGQPVVLSVRSEAPRSRAAGSRRRLGSYGLKEWRTKKNRSRCCQVLGSRCSSTAAKRYC